MQTLLQRASDVIADHPAPALPLCELRRLVRGAGVAVGEETLLRALAGGAERFRVVDPWRGPWRALRGTAVGGRRGMARHAARRTGARRPGPPPTRPSADPGGDDSVLRGLRSRWVVARPGSRGRRDGRGPAERLRETLAHLGWTVDAASVRDLARWCRLVHEGGRVRTRLRELTAS